MIAYKFLRGDGSSVFTSLYEIELAGEIVAEPTKLVASRTRLLRPITPGTTAEERQGTAAYHKERGRQTAWLVERLGLQGAAPS